jgi:hypothetical protein
MYAGKNGMPKMRGSTRFASGMPSVSASTGTSAKATDGSVVLGFNVRPPVRAA